jgi:hypothetical protein
VERLTVKTLRPGGITSRLTDESEQAERADDAGPEAALLVQGQGPSGRVVGRIDPSGVPVSGCDPTQRPGQHRSERGV